MTRSSTSPLSGKTIFFLFFIANVFSSVLSGCGKSENPEPENTPEISIVEIISHSPKKVTMKGAIKAAGKFSVLDHGFEYSTNEQFSAQASKKVSLGAKSSAGEFSATVEELELGTVPASGAVLYVKAYFTSSGGTVYTAPVQVKMLQTGTSAVSPVYGKIGDKIILTGTFYVSDSKQIKVFFDEKEAKVISASNERLEIEVPSGLPQQHGQHAHIYVLVDGQKSTATSTFSIYATFRDFSPKSGVYGTPLTFTGENLPASGGSVEFITAIVDGISTPVHPMEQPMAYLPPITSITSKVKVRVKDAEVELPGEFTLLPPVFEPILLTELFTGDGITLKDKNFPENLRLHEFDVLLGNDQHLTAKPGNGGHWIGLPELPEGVYKISAQIDPFHIDFSEKITVKHHKATSFSPSSGFPNTDLRIEGQFSPGRTYYVHFGNEKVQAWNVLANELFVGIPLLPNKEGMKVKVETFTGKIIDLPGTFTLLHPSITSISPLSGKAGTRITIRGRNFNPKASANIKFGRQPCDAETISEDTITFIVPQGLAPGTYPIALSFNLQPVEGTQNFTLIE